MKKSLSKSLTFLVGAIIVLQLNGSVLADELSTPPVQNNIAITNNLEIADTIKVTNLKSGDLVTVYGDNGALGTATVPETSTEAIVSIPQLGIASGSVFVTVTSAPLIESARVEQIYAAEVLPPKVENITIVNNVSISDTIKVVGLNAGDIVKVYKTDSIITTLATAKVAALKTEATISISQLSKDPGSVFVTVTGLGLKESVRIEKTYVAEQLSTKPVADKIKIVNNALIPDTVNVIGLSEGDIVKVYNVVAQGKALGTSTVAKGKNQATVSISQITEAAGKVYVSVTNKGKLESEREEALDAGNVYVSVTNKGKLESMREEASY